MTRKFWIIVLLFAAGCGAHGASSTLPTTTGGHVHRMSVITPVITVPAPTFGAMGHFQVFDEKGTHSITHDQAVADGPRYGVIWGARSTLLTAWRTNNSSIVLGYYFGFPSDFDASSFGNLGHTVSWWKTNHLSWIEYECNASGNPTVPAKIGSEGDVILDLTNPDVLNYQVDTLTTYFAGTPYNAISLDTLDLSNVGNACGHYDADGVVFVRQFADPNDFKDMAVSWTQSFVARMHALSPAVGVVANNIPEGQTFGDTHEAALLDAVDMVLDESGPTATGSYRSNGSMVKMLEWMDYVQNTDGHGWLDVSNFAPPETSVTQAESEFAAGMYLVGLGQTNRYTEVFIGLKSTYGLENWYPTLYNAAFGTPCTAYNNSVDPSLFTRRYTNGFIAVDNSATSTESVTLPAIIATSQKWADYSTGTIVTSPATVQPHGALLLVQSPASGTTCT